MPICALRRTFEAPALSENSKLCDALRCISGATVGLVISVSCAGAGTLFMDDFESGNLNNWTVGGRQLLGTNIADTVVRNGSTVGHLYKTSFTEISLQKSFAYNPMWQLAFDMEVAASSQPPPSAAYYASSGVDIYFLDQSLGALGSVSYLYNTTDHLANLFSNDPTRSMVAVAPGAMTRYSLDAIDLLSMITIDQTMIGSIDVVYRTYSSTAPYPGTSAELWLDNVNVNDDPLGVVPLPASVILLGSTFGGLGGLVLTRRRRRMS